ncbi:MAG: folate family ECF transporter S component [Firmicutes bacterium]|nr:folate family ECF transporter S component [Bacillota bacterium]
MKLRTRDLTNAGLFVAMSIALSRFAAVQVMSNTIRLSFGNIPIYVAGLLFGPAIGGLVGGVADLAGYLVNPFGAAFIPQITLAAILRGVIPPLVVRLFGAKDSFWQLKIFLAIIATEIVSGAFLTTWGLSWLNQTPFMAVLTPRLVALALQIPVYTIATYVLIVPLRAFRAQRSAGK